MSTALTCVAVISSCSKEPLSQDSALESLAMQTLSPRTVVPGTKLVIRGESFVGAPWGQPFIRLLGTFNDSTTTHDINVLVTAEFVDYTTLSILADEGFMNLLPAKSGRFTGTALVEVTSAVNGKTYRSDPIDIDIDFRVNLAPVLTQVVTGDAIFTNEAVQLRGDGFLLGDQEGTTMAIVEGCVTRTRSTECRPTGEVRVPIQPSTTFDRTQAQFAFGPQLVGIHPGTFTGTIRLENTQAGTTHTSETAQIAYNLLPVSIHRVTPKAASLGQFVDFAGGGFVGGSDAGFTTLLFRGSYKPARAQEAVAIDIELAAEFASGRHIRYVLNESDNLGSALDLRRDSGVFEGTVVPVVHYKSERYFGAASNVSFAIGTVKQIVFVDFRPSYVESLRRFGLRAVDTQIRKRVIEIANRDFATINIEFRLDRPTDYKLYSRVEIAGPDVNGIGLLGYDNTPGKDHNNARLDDQIGGFNATTQKNGDPGFGGVFIESLFAFSKHPNGLAKKISPERAFDDIFDPFRPDRGGSVVMLEDFLTGIPERTHSDGCPASERSDQIACAIWVLGSMIGTTMTHEIGHSLGLANPTGQSFHNFGDEPNRLMDAGGSRPFAERAELFGEGPARFCQGEYDYLRRILPSPQPPDRQDRPSCL